MMCLHVYIVNLLRVQQRNCMALLLLHICWFISWMAAASSAPKLAWMDCCAYCLRHPALVGFLHTFLVSRLQKYNLSPCLPHLHVKRSYKVSRYHVTWYHHKQGDIMKKGRRKKEWKIVHNSTRLQEFVRSGWNSCTC